jgi:hypothetical protein
LAQILNWRRRGADKWTLDSTRQGRDPIDLDRDVWLMADVTMDGCGYLFYGGAAQMRNRGYGSSVLYLFERGIAANLAQFLALVGALYRAGGQWGPLDVGMAVTGINGAVSAEFSQTLLRGQQPYADEQATRAMRVDARELQEDPHRISLKLLNRLLRAASGGDDWDPLSG